MEKVVLLICVGGVLLLSYMHDSGQFGKVYKGVYRKPGNKGAGIDVAIKTIKKYDSKTETDSFLKEMSVMSTLIHPNVVRFYGLVQKGI